MKLERPQVAEIKQNITCSLEAKLEALKPWGVCVFMSNGLKDNRKRDKLRDYK